MLAKSGALISDLVRSSSGKGYVLVKALYMIVAGAAATRQIKSMTLRSSSAIDLYRGEMMGILMASFRPSTTFKLKMRRMSRIVTMTFLAVSRTRLPIIPRRRWTTWTAVSEPYGSTI